MNIRAPFVVAEQESGESLQRYLDRVFREYETYKNYFIGEDAQGHSQVLEITEAGSYVVAIKPQHRVSYVTLIASPGPYTFDVKLSNSTGQDNKDGDIVQIFFKQVEVGTGPVIRIQDQDNDILFTKTFDGSATDNEFKQFLVYQSQWNS